MRPSRRAARRLLALGLALLLGLGTASAPARAAGSGPADSFRRGVPHMATEQPRAGDRHASVSQGVKNMVRRAYQLTDIAWTPVANIEGWKNRDRNRFYAGVRYTGIPYGQPHRSGSYVPWQTGLSEFLGEIANPGSLMYSRQAVSQVQQNPAPFFSCECSAFVSWAWELPNRETTKTLGQYAVQVPAKLSSLQVGDCILKEGKHCRLVTDITYDAQNNISGIEISEEREPAAYRRWYLAGSESRPLSSIQTDYLDQGYVVLRFRDRDQIGYTHSCAVPLAGDVCPVCGANPFADLPLDRWYSRAVAFVCNQGIMAGTAQSLFSPGLEINRAMFVTVLWRMYHSPAGTGTPPFKDIKVGSYYYEALRWASANGLAAGVGGGNFGPDRLCTRAQIVTFLWVAAGRPQAAESCPFRDVPGDAYYRQALCWAVDRRIVSGRTPDSFDPTATATRAEAAVMLWRYCQAMGLYH